MKKIAIFLSIFVIYNAWADINTQNTCGITPAIIYAKFTPNTYTCDTGYYLPAYSDVCEPCPNGYECSGGTFNFSDTKSQGLVRTSATTQNANNACAINFPHVMEAIFIQNETITVNFQNGEITEIITCTYGDDLTLPEPPTRVGYTFSGWKVKTTE